MNKLLLAAPLALSFSLAACATSADRTGNDDVEKAAVEQDLDFPTYDRNTVLNEAKNVFGEASAELAEVISDVFAKEGRPQAYIAGEEAGGAIGVGATYGKGMLYRPNLDPIPVFWQGPSVGFDVGADASEVFALVYDLGDTDRLYRRFPGAEGNIFVVGGVAAEYLRTDGVTVVPVRTGVGARAGVNVGYMNFTRERKILPF